MRNYHYYILSYSGQDAYVQIMLESPYAHLSCYTQTTFAILSSSFLPVFILVLGNLFEISNRDLFTGIYCTNSYQLVLTSLIHICVSYSSLLLNRYVELWIKALSTTYSVTWQLWVQSLGLVMLNAHVLRFHGVSILFISSFTSSEICKEKNIY